MKTDARTILIVGVLIGLLLLVLAAIIERTPGSVHPSQLPAPSVTPASLPAPRTLGTATQGAP